MIEIKFGICEKVYFFNSASRKIESGEVQGIRVIGTDIATDENGEHKCNAFEVIYELTSRLCLTGAETFGSYEECKAGLEAALKEL